MLGLQCFYIFYGALLFEVPLAYSKKPYNKREETIWRMECDLGVISDSECPVDGGWAPWNPWSVCHGSCDDVGNRRRTRECINPPPSKDGAPCSGPDEQIEPCYLTNCTVEDYYRLAIEDSARNESLHQLEAVPALMERCLLTECSYEMIESALASDNTWQLNPELLWDSLQCVKYNLGCLLVGEWGKWGPWSTCGARCGKGIRWRLRRCDTPPPSDSRLICAGSPLQSEECKGNQCAYDDFDMKLDFGGTWSAWGPWTRCSEQCGPGVRRRRRICNEYQEILVSGTWSTHCNGQHDQLEVCISNQCKLDGEWSGWSTWGPCSQTCGSGKRTRTRSCTRPVPTGDGAKCTGSKTDVGSCYLIPCECYSHVVAVFNGDSFLEYNFTNKRSTLFHFYIRFMALSPHGILVRRGIINSPLVRLSIHKWHICLDASGLSKTCSIARICSPVILEPESWHSALVTVTSVAATLRIDDSRIPIQGNFQCEPELPDEKMHIIIGERFHGEIQEVILNFIPLYIIVERDHSTKKKNFIPSSGLNIAYEKSRISEAFVILDSDQYIRLPCFDNLDEWQLQFTVKSNRESGTILFLHSDKYDNWLLMVSQNKRLKIKLAIGALRTEIISSVERPPSEWLDVKLSKTEGTNTIEALINGGERLHLVFGKETPRRRRKQHSAILRKTNLSLSTPEFTYIHQHRPRKFIEILEISHDRKELIVCDDEFFVGGVPPETKSFVRDEEFTPLSGIVASISVNNFLKDLHMLNIERYKGNKVQVSSRSASVSGSYHETAWGHSNRLNLTCLHARTIQSPHAAHWLFLDTGIDEALKDKPLRSMDDGRVLRLVASADNDLRGFYTCRAHANKRTCNIVTYGVLGQIHYKLAGPDAVTGIALFTTLTLAIGTLSWLVFEGLNDLRNGYGFFRDRHISPEKEAEAVCNYIDDNIHIIGSTTLANIAKAKARRKGRQLASRRNFAAQEPQEMLHVERCKLEESSFSEPDELPALPPIKSSAVNLSQDVFRLEASYVSSPRQGSDTMYPNAKLTSTTSIEVTSPRFLCAHLLLSKRKCTSRNSYGCKRTKSTGRIKPISARKARSNLLTIKSSSFVNLSPVQKIIHRFQQLKSYDP